MNAEEYEFYEHINRYRHQYYKELADLRSELSMLDDSDVFLQDKNVQKRIKEVRLEIEELEDTLEIYLDK